MKIMRCPIPCLVDVQGQQARNPLHTALFLRLPHYLSCLHRILSKGLQHGIFRVFYLASLPCKTMARACLVMESDLQLASRRRIRHQCDLSNSRALIQSTLPTLQISTEVRAGVTSFLTLSYILLVNPKVMGEAGLAPEDVVSGTCISCCLSTIIVGLFGEHSPNTSLRHAKRSRLTM
jgi:hypothetical protein